MGVLVSEGGQGRWTSGNLGRASAGPGGLLHSPAACLQPAGGLFSEEAGIPRPQAFEPWREEELCRFGLVLAFRSLGRGFQPGGG